MLALIFGLVLCIAHYFSYNIHINYLRHKELILSFTAGISVSYIFLYLFPEVVYRMPNHYIFFYVLIGFSIFHLIEKHASKHEYSRRRREKKEIHSAAFFIYHFIIGIVLFNMTAADITRAALFFVPVLLHTTVSSVSMKEIHPHARERLGIKILLSVSTLLGVLFAMGVNVSSVYRLMLGFVVGAMLYIVTRDAIPTGKKGRPEFFVLGIIIFILIMLMAGM